MKENEFIRMRMRLYGLSSNTDSVAFLTILCAFMMVFTFVFSEDLILKILWCFCFGASFTLFLRGWYFIYVLGKKTRPHVKVIETKVGKIRY